MEAGEAGEVGEFEVEVACAFPFRGEEIVWVVEWGVGAGIAGSGVAFGGGLEGGERGFVGFEGGGVGADSEDADLHGVALTDEREDVEAADDFTEDRVFVVEPVLGAEHEAELGAVGVWAVVAHLERADGVVTEAWDDFVGEEVAGVAVAGACGVAALDDEAWDDAAPCEAVVEGFSGFGAEGAFGEADVVGDGERGFFVEEFGDDGAAFGGDFGVETVWEGRGGVLGA